MRWQLRSNRRSQITGTPEPRFLFVCGVGRSGTTALAHLVDSHPDVVLGVARFTGLWNPARIAEMRPALFARDRFFDFSDGLTNITPELAPKWARHYDHAAEKYDRARFLGDKMTQP